MSNSVVLAPSSTKEEGVSPRVDIDITLSKLERRLRITFSDLPRALVDDLSQTIAGIEENLGWVIRESQDPDLLVTCLDSLHRFLDLLEMTAGVPGVPVRAIRSFDQALTQSLDVCADRIAKAASTEDIAAAIREDLLPALAAWGECEKEILEAIGADPLSPAVDIQTALGELERTLGDSVNGLTHSTIDALNDVIDAIGKELRPAAESIREEQDASRLGTCFQDLGQFLGLLEMLGNIPGAPQTAIATFDETLTKSLDSGSTRMEAATSMEDIAAAIEQDVLPSLARWSQCEQALRHAIEPEVVSDGLDIPAKLAALTDNLGDSVNGLTHTMVSGLTDVIDAIGQELGCAVTKIREEQDASLLGTSFKNLDQFLGLLEIIGNTPGAPQEAISSFDKILTHCIDSGAHRMDSATCIDDIAEAIEEDLLPSLAGWSECERAIRNSIDPEAVCAPVDIKSMLEELERRLCSSRSGLTHTTVDELGRVLAAIGKELRPAAARLRGNQDATLLGRCFENLEQFLGLLEIIANTPGVPQVAIGSFDETLTKSLDSSAQRIQAATCMEDIAMVIEENLLPSFATWSECEHAIRNSIDPDVASTYAGIHNILS